MSWAFANCTNIVSIPENLFVNNLQLTNCYGTFSNFYALTAIPANLFTNQNLITDFTSCFSISSTSVSYNKVTGNVPTL